MKHLKQYSTPIGFILFLMLYVFVASNIYAHHAADGMVDEEIYEEIDLLLDGTPHADMTLEDLGGVSTTMTIVVDDQETYDQLVDDGLLDLINDLDGSTLMVIAETSDGGYIITVIDTGENNTVENADDNYYGDDSGDW